MKFSWKGKGIGEWFAAAAAVIGILVLIIYAVYTSGLSILNPIVVLAMLACIVINVLYFGCELNVPIDVPGLLEIAAAALTAFSLVRFLKVSMNNLADLLNGIQIFSGGSGDVRVIFTILFALLGIGILEIIACFAGRKS